MSVLKWTPEQNAILPIETDFLLVIAFAGTGKTTLLSEYANRRPESSFLYTAFNNHTINEAYGKFPLNTTVITTHSLAYKSVGYLYQHKLKSRINHKEILEILMLDNNQNSVTISKMIKDVIDGYCFSHIVDIKKYINTIKIENKIKSVIKDFSLTVWEKLVDTQNSYGISHDIYFKIFCNSKPILNFDYILFDEAQDSNDALKFLLIEQLKYNKKLIFTGDSHQSMYSFRGTKDILKGLVSTKTAYLTHSFRFGKNIAQIANKILNYKKETQQIIGASNTKDFVGKVDFSQNFAVISRTNAGILSRALNLIGKNKKIFFIGGLKSYHFYKAKDVEHLYNDKIERISNPNVVKYRSFKDLLDHAGDNGDNELLGFAQLVLNFNGRLIPQLEHIEAMTVENEVDADVVMATAHKAKGLEFDQVVLTNDYYNIPSDDNLLNYDILKEEELNIIYVGITRAKIRLELNNNLKAII
jgi:F-box protein 18 (helicase)